MTYTDYVIKTDGARTAFQIGVSSAIAVESATQEQKLAWIAEDLKKLYDELDRINKEFDEQDEVGDPFASSVKQ